MTKAEFVAICRDSGYASRKTAEKYASGRDEFTIDDLVEVFRLNEHKLAVKNGEVGRARGYRVREGVRTTKYFKNRSGDG